ncbi:MAG: tail fiber domain-containing protein, partial [Halanaeroarchaeum sp.]
YGGTGASSFEANAILLGNGTSAFGTISPDAGGSDGFLKTDGTGWAPGNIDADEVPGLDADKIITGTFDTARIPDLGPEKITGGGTFGSGDYTFPGNLVIDDLHIGETSHSIINFTGASDYRQPSGYRTMVRNESGGSTELPPGWTGYGYYQVMARRDSDDGYHGLFFGYNSGRVWVAENTVGSNTPNYHEVLTEDTPSFETAGALTVGGALDAQSLSLSTALPISEGGTGADTWESNALLLGNGTSAFGTISPDPAGSDGFLKTDGVSWAPGNIDSSDLPAISADDITAGTFASASTYAFPSGSEVRFIYGEGLRILAGGDMTGVPGNDTRVLRIEDSNTPSQPDGALVITAGDGDDVRQFWQWGEIGFRGADVTFDVGQINTSGVITGLTWQGSDIDVEYGGTGASSFEANAILLGNGTSAFGTISPDAAGSDGFLKTDGVGWAPGNINTDEVPGLDADKIITGTFDTARIPDLSASKITSGTFDTARIPDLAASKITPGTFGGSTTYTFPDDLDVTGEVRAGVSDIRLKRDVTPIHDALDRVCALGPIRYRLADGVPGEHGRPLAGLSAQELLEAMPEAVRRAPFDDDGEGGSVSGEDYLTYQPEVVIPYLVGAIRDLREEVAALRSRRTA